ncbi:MAG: hypothetical protein WD063_11000 [Pirellulales bacterium]
MRTTSATLHRAARGFQPRLEPLEARTLMAVDVILEWNDVLLAANANDHALVSPEQGGPILTARAFAIVSAAMYDAYNSVENIGRPYLVAVPRADRADSDAAVAQAAHNTLEALYPAQEALFDAALTQTLDRIRNGIPESLGRAVGAYVAHRILRVREDDGAADLANNTYVWNGELGFHKADPLHPDQGYYASSAMDVDPFAVRSLDHFEARRLDDGTPAGRAEFLEGEEYTLAYDEALALGGDGVTSPTERTDEQTTIGIFWAYDGRPGLGTPPRLYNQIVRTVAVQEHNSEAENARLFALVNIAMADAGLASWTNKYDDAFWRPIMGIRGGDDDGNLQTDGFADWTPLGSPASNPRPGETNFTPPFPAYTSGHATFGAAAFQILTRFYGRDDISFTFVSDEFNGLTRGSDGEVRPVVSRTFDSFTEAKLENAQSRIYLGIHWAFDRDDGVRQGNRAANYIFNNFFRPTHHHGDGHSNPDTSPLAIQPNPAGGDDDKRETNPAGSAELRDREPLTAAQQSHGAASQVPGQFVDRVMSELGASQEAGDAESDASAIVSDKLIATLGSSVR